MNTTKNVKRCLQRMVSMLLVCMLVLPSLLPAMVSAEETGKSPSDASDYYNARINTTSTLIEADLFTPIKKVARNTPVHLTGEVKKEYGETGVDENGAATYGTLVHVEVELADSYFNYCVKIGATNFPHIGNAHGWYVPYNDIILSGSAASINDTADIAKEATSSRK